MYAHAPVAIGPTSDKYFFFPNHIAFHPLGKDSRPQSFPDRLGAATKATRGWEKLDPFSSLGYKKPSFIVPASFLTFQINFLRNHIKRTGLK